MDFSIVTPYVLSTSLLDDHVDKKKDLIFRFLKSWTTLIGFCKYRENIPLYELNK
jgi:hypothetical protein